MTKKVSEQIAVKVIPSLGLYICDVLQNKEIAITKEELFSLIAILQEAYISLCE